MSAPTLFDFAKADAIERADLHADPEWREVALTAVRLCAATLPDFTADDVWSLLDISDATTHEPSALGPVFLRASRLGHIRKTGATRPSTSPRRHRDLTVWRKT